MGTRNKPNIKLDLDKLKQNVIDYPDSYLKERATRLGVSDYCINYNFKELGVIIYAKLYSGSFQISV